MNGPRFVSVTSSAGSDTCALPAGFQVGDLLMVVIRSAQPHPTLGVFAGGFWTMPPVAGKSPTYFDWTVPSSWCFAVGLRIIDGTEPGSITFTQAPGGGVLVGPVEICMLRFTGLDLHFGVGLSGINAFAVTDSFAHGEIQNAVFPADSYTEATLLIAICGAKNTTPPAPAGFTQHFGGTRVNVSSRTISLLNFVSSVGFQPADVDLGAPDQWGTEILGLTANMAIFDIPALRWEASVLPPMAGCGTDES